MIIKRFFLWFLTPIGMICLAGLVLFGSLTVWQTIKDKKGPTQEQAKTSERNRERIGLMRPVQKELEEKDGEQFDTVRVEKDSLVSQFRPRGGFRNNPGLVSSVVLPTNDTPDSGPPSSMLISLSDNDRASRQKSTKESLQVAAKKRAAAIARAAQGVNTGSQFAEGFLPRGTLVPCQLIFSVESNGLTNPLVAYVLKDVWHAGKKVIPAGVEVHSLAKGERIRDRLQINHSFSFIWHDGSELEVAGLVLARDYDDATGMSSEIDGSAGLPGQIVETARGKELQLIIAQGLAGAARGAVDREYVEGFFGPRELSNGGPVNGMLEGLGSASEEYTRIALRELEARERFVRVPAGTEFYVYLLEIADPANRQHGGLRGPDAKTYQPDAFNIGTSIGPGQNSPARPQGPSGGGQILGNEELGAQENGSIKLPSGIIVPKNVVDMIPNGSSLLKKIPSIKTQ